MHSAPSTTLKPGSKGIFHPSLLHINLNLRPRQLMDSDAPSRIALLDKLATFGCAVSGCKQSDVHPHSNRLKLSILPAGLSVVARFLDGPEGEVPAGVRRRAFTVLSDSIKHHTMTPERDGLLHAATTILRGVVDPDRSVRLAAGWDFSYFLRTAF